MNFTLCSVVCGRSVRQCFKNRYSTRVLNNTKKKLLRGFQATDYRVEFTKWWVNEFKTVKFPPNGTVFDCYIDTETKQFVPWTQRLGRFELDHDMPLQVI